MDTLIAANNKRYFDMNLKEQLMGIISLFSMMTFPAIALSMDEQRTQYEAAITAIENKDLDTFKTLKADLTKYPLYPYLAYRQITQELDKTSTAQLLEFEKKYKDLPFIHTVRARYIQKLEKEENWKVLLSLQKTPLRAERHQCNYYYAKSQVGDEAGALKGGKSLYLSGASIDSACDKLFSWMKEKGKITDDLNVERMLLAFERGRSKSLLRYLQKQLTEKSAVRGEQIIALSDDPSLVAEFSKKRKVTPHNQRLTTTAFKSLVRKNKEEAVSQFAVTVKGQHFNIKERQELADYIIHFLMSTEDPKLLKWRDHWLSTTKNQSLLERRFRIALLENNWKEMERWLNFMSDKKLKDLTWRYWRARVKLEKGDTKKANAIFKSMLGERHFYSVAAAMHLNKEIKVPQQTLTLNSKNVNKFQAPLGRISELLKGDKVPEAKREWHYILLRSSTKEKAMLAAFALEKRWHHLSVQATIMGKLWEHLEYRFPMPHRWWFNFFSKEREVSLTTLLALSRQESAFYSLAVSPVGARGLMQLMPSTAKETSEKLGLTYLGKDSLNDPETNINLGSAYLRMLLDSFDKNRILAFAAYNAGPNRVKTWLNHSKGQLDVIAFIESIPFYETRGYVQNVLMYEIYYRKLLGLPLEFLNKAEIARNY